MKSEKNLPMRCPSCGGRLHVSGMVCPECDTAITGDYRLPLLMRLGSEERAFVLDFVRSSGSLKEMSRRMGLSYPTVRNKLDEIIETINRLEADENDL